MKYHAQATAVLLMLSALVSTANATPSIWWSGVQDVTIGLGPGVSSTYFDINGDGINNFVFINEELSLSLSPISNSAAIADPTWQPGKTRYRPVEEMMIIDASLDPPYEWSQSEDTILSYMMHIPSGELIGGGSWHTVSNGLLGISFDIEGNTHYGWMRMSDISATTFIVHDWAYEAQPGVGINAGVIPEPSTLLLVTLGAGTLFGMRSHKRKKPNNRLHHYG